MTIYRSRYCIIDEPTPEIVALPKKESKKPSTEMRSLFWQRIPVNVVQNTVWHTLTDDRVALDTFDMELFFRKNATTTNGNTYIYIYIYAAPGWCDAAHLAFPFRFDLCLVGSRNAMVIRSSGHRLVQ
jgi:hypothetical protein